jgi:SAM-dependent methyltransferase
MSNIFEAEYAAAYDVVYAEKDYRQEADAVFSLIEQYGELVVQRILDLGCGTGRHAILLAERGLDVTGVDRSKPMLELAQRRALASRCKGRTEFVEGDIRQFASGRRFEAALMMFNVLGYMATNDDLTAALNCVRENLAPGGTFIFDIWYGPAIVANPPGHRLKEIKTADGIVVRYASPAHDPHNQRCDVTIRVLQIVGDRVAATSEEAHRVRYFFPLEIDLALKSAGFHLEALRGFPEIDAPPSLSSWSSVVIAKRL